jgi:hypothetical protein
MKRLARWLLNGLTALSLLLSAATIAAWIFSCQHPWQASVEFDKFAPNNGGYTFSTEPGTWRVFWNERQRFYGGWGGYVSADAGTLKIESYTPGGPGWDNGWGKFLLIWLFLPLWRSVPRQAESTPSSTWQWLMRRPPIRVVSLLQELYSIFLASSLASYLVAWLMGIEWAGDGFGTPWELLWAPLMIPPDILNPLGNPTSLHLGILVSSYLGAMLAFYIWRTNSLIHKSSPNLAGSLVL